MVNRIPDATGWISENGETGAHVLTPHAGIAFVAIIIIALLIGQLIRQPRQGDRVDDEEWD